MPNSDWLIKGMGIFVVIVLFLISSLCFFEIEHIKKDIETFNAKYPSDEGEYDIKEIIQILPVDSFNKRDMLYLLKELPDSKVISYAVIKEKEHYELRFMTELPLSGDVSTKSIYIKPLFNANIKTIQITVFDKGINIKFPMEYMKMNDTVLDQSKDN